MPCEGMRKKNQTLQQRATEVRAAVSRLDRLLLTRKVRPIIGPQGAVAFAGAGWEEARAGVTDACAYRRIMSTGSALARAELARAEQVAGRGVDRKVVAAGVHSHDGGETWGGKG